MLIKYTYPVVGDIFLPDHWPVSWDRYQLTWEFKDGKAQSVTIAVRTEELSSLPQIEKSNRPGFAADIRIDEQPNHQEVETIVRTAFGLLGFFADAHIDLDRPSIAWEAETEEESTRLKMLSFSVEPDEPNEPPPISYDLVARCFLSAIPASGNEVPLRFLCKARRDMDAKRYIDAYYSYYFFLETQFAPGYSKPKVVKPKLRATSEISEAMNRAREAASSDHRSLRGMNDLLKLSDGALIDHLVDTRGKLHHHSLPRKTGSWHPDKHDEFRVEALFLSFLANEIAQNQNLPILFNETIDKQLQAAARQEGVEYSYTVEAEGEFDGRRSDELPDLHIKLPSRSPSYGGLVALEEFLRGEGAPYDRKVVRSYVVKSTDGSNIFARYRNNTLGKK